MNPTRNDLPLKARTAAAAILNARLADILDLRSHLKQAHWNIKGPGFHAVHELLDMLAAECDTFADDVAERAVQLGATALGTSRMVAAATTLPDYPAKVAAQQRTLQTIADHIAAVAKSVRAAIDEADELEDPGTADLFTGISRGLDKQLWFVESHLLPDR
jgi:starvation-inducible DNA-binding protein